MRFLMKNSLLLAAMLTVFAVAAPVATADQPTKEPLPLPTEPFEVSDICPFTITVEVVANKEALTTFANGRFLVTGQLFVRLTNVAKPENSILASVSGPAHSNPDGTLTATGNGVFFVSAGLSPTGEPLFALTSGPTLSAFNEEGILFPLSLPHHVVDVCELLA
jgi:hypothetical protein